MFRLELAGRIMKIAKSALISPSNTGRQNNIAKPERAAIQPGMTIVTRRSPNLVGALRKRPQRYGIRRSTPVRPASVPGHFFPVVAARLHVGSLPLLARRTCVASSTARTRFERDPSTALAISLTTGMSSNRRDRRTSARKAPTWSCIASSLRVRRCRLPCSGSHPDRWHWTS